MGCSMVPCVCLSCSLLGWQCCPLLQGAGVVCKALGHGPRVPTMACATGTCCPSLAFGAQPRACGPTLMLGQVPTSLGPHQKAVRLRLENKHSDFFKRRKTPTIQVAFFFFFFYLSGFFFFLLNHEMTHTSELKINPITSWRATAARRHRVPPRAARASRASCPRSPLGAVGSALGAQVALTGLLMELKCC